MRIVLFCTTANSKANAVYNVLHIPEEDVILKYSDDKLEEKLNEVKEEQKNIKEYNLYIEAYKKFHKYDDVDILTDKIRVYPISFQSWPSMRISFSGSIGIKDKCNDYKVKSETIMNLIES
jgi:hypothetical protein